MHDRNRIARLAKEVAHVRELVSRKAGPVHMLGIGGVGMAGVAALLHGRGLNVSGCDGTQSTISNWLQKSGIPVASGHDPRHLEKQTAWLIRSPAVRDEEPELAAAKSAGLPVFARGVVLPALLDGLRSIAVGGTHGKTTTTAMISHILRQCGVDASFCVGGVVEDGGRVAATGRDKSIVVEADESDGTIALYSPDIAVVTNVEMDHVDYFGTEADLHDCFLQFGSQSRLVIYGADDRGARTVFEKFQNSEGFGFGAGRWRAVDVDEEAFSISFTVLRDGIEQGRARLGAPGRHNALNALAALAVASHFAIPFAQTAAALASFKPVRRRFDILARTERRILISDFAHHPTEIRALMSQALRLPYDRTLAVYQPHRFTRTAAMGRELAEAFHGLDYLALAPTYSAFEDPVTGGDVRDLARLFEQANHVSAWCGDSLLAAWEHIRERWRDGDALLVIGAGDVEKIAFWAKEFLESADISK